MNGKIADVKFASSEHHQKCPDGEIGRHKGLKIPRLETAVPVRFRLRAPILVMAW